jgi:hypothetical protein
MFMMFKMFEKSPVPERSRREMFKMFNSINILNQKNSSNNSLLLRFSVSPFHFFIISRSAFSFSDDQYLQSSWMKTEE